MTKAEAQTTIARTPDDELGDVLMQLAALYWLEQPDMTKDEVLYLFEETLEETDGD